MAPIRGALGDAIIGYQAVGAAAVLRDDGHDDHGDLLAEGEGGHGRGSQVAG